MSSKPTIDVKEYIENQRFSTFHWIIFILCFLVVLMDGYDTVAIGYVARSIIDDWGVSHEALGSVMSAALVGLGMGAFFGGPLADRFGRRVVIAVSTILFGLFSGLSSVASSLDSLMILRFLTGLGLGAAMPNSVALMSEFAPKRVRSLTVNSQLMGFSAGSAVAGVASAWLIPRFGWQSVFIVGGIAPVVLAALLVFLLPESVQFLVLRNPTDARIPKTLSKLSRSEPLPDVSFTLSNEQSLNSRSRRGLILSREYRFGTILLWIVYFMNLTVYYLLAGWLPTLFRDAGFSLQRASLISSMLPIGGVLGIVVVGFLMDRIDSKRVVGWIYITVALVTILVGQTLGMPTVLCVLMFLMGAMTNSAGTSISTIAAQFYGSECRSTGVSWMYTVGRFGGVFGMFAGAALTGIGWQFASVFAILAVPAFIAGTGLLVLAKVKSGSRAETEESKYSASDFVMDAKRAHK
jgi:MFS transporter, AAHS family, 4-hydroxybenzoate transporter